MADEIFETIHVYSWGKPAFVAFLDILGFQSAMAHTNKSSDSSSVQLSSGDLTFSLWRNCLPQRSRLTHSPMLNFVQMSDSLVVYGDEFKSVVRLVCDVYGSALVWGVPIRGGLGYGVLNHAEDKSRPGTILTIYGDGLNDANATEKSGKGLGMRFFLSEKLIRNVDIEEQNRRNISQGLVEFPWWLNCGIDKEHFAERSALWWTKKTVNKWFKGSQRDDTKSLFERAISELEQKC